MHYQEVLQMLPDHTFIECMCYPAALYQSREN